MAIARSILPLALVARPAGIHGQLLHPVAI
eukprot:SAG31_NODE_41605_length_275_cov_0.715909_1_plen_29_part_10